MTDVWVQRGAEQYADTIAGELPTGQAWPRDPSSDLMRWVDGCSQIWGGVDGEAAELAVVEADPRSTFHLLPEWESAFGLPEICVHSVQTIEDRQQALVSKITTLGGQSRAFFIAQAAALGYTISIYEFAPFTCGISECGETRADGKLTVTYAECGAMECGADTICTIVQSGGDEWAWECGPSGSPASAGLVDIRSIWRVKVSGNRLSWFRGGSGECGRDHHCEIASADDLECMFRRLKPAHTEVIFDYSATDTKPVGGRLDARTPQGSLAATLLLF